MAPKRGFRPNIDESPEKFRARLLALAQKYPMKLPGIVGPGSTENLLSVPTCPMPSMVRSQVQFHTVASPAAGNFYYSLDYFISAGFWRGNRVSATAITESTLGNGVFTTYTQSDDPLYAIASSFVDDVQTNARCLRVMSPNALLYAGAEILFGTIPITTFTNNIDWRTLSSYKDVKQVVLPMAQDVCYPWLPSQDQDFGVTSVSATISVPNTNESISVVFVAVRYPYSSTAPTPAMDIECYSNYTVTIEPNYQGIVPVKVQPIDEVEFDRAKRLIGLTNISALDVENTANIDQCFSQAAQILGKRVSAYVGKLANRASRWIMSSSNGSMFSSRLRSQLRLLDGGQQIAAEAKELCEKGLLPRELVEILEKLGEWNLFFSKHGRLSVVQRGSAVWNQAGKSVTLNAPVAPLGRPTIVVSEESKTDETETPDVWTPISVPTIRGRNR